MLKLEKQIKESDLVITGEGMLDASSLEGKTPVSVALMAKKLGVPCVAIVGAVEPKIIWLEEVGISKVYALFDKPFIINDPRTSQMSDRFNEAVTKLLKDFPEETN
jgi:glycerate kinase